MRKLWLLLCALVCILAAAPRGYAAQAADISGKELVQKHTGFSSLNALFDGRTMDSLRIRKGGSLTLAHEAGIGSVYIVWGTEYGSYTVTAEDTGETAVFGEQDFLHEFLDLEAAFGYAPKTLTIHFDNGDAKVNELSVFGPGQVPDWVQRWDAPAEGKADLVLFSTHGDDEQLFFAGMLPYYARERGMTVQVVYMTDHRNMTMRRSHEMLDGLWAVGVTRYPVFGPFGDYNTRSLAEAYQKYRYKGIEKEDILAYVVENIRRFRPKVAVGHDLRGEYGHGMHMVYAQALCDALEVSADASAFADSAEAYGIWEVPKTYLHLYPENTILLDWDIPLESFDGMTAYEVTKELGFPCHVSQQSYYSSYFAGKDRASQITEYSPCEFGLYRSIVGADQQRNDFFEHMTTHAEDAVLEELYRAEETAPEETEPIPRETTAVTVPEETAAAALPAQSPAVPVQEEKNPAKELLIPVLAGAGLLALAALITVAMGPKTEPKKNEKNN